MNDPESARFTSEVRSLRQRSEPLATSPATTGKPFEHPRPRTTRFRLERVSLLPFIPAPLIAYVERARLRRRTRLVALGAVIVAGIFAVTLWLVLFPTRFAVTATTRATAAAPIPAPATASTVPEPSRATLAAAPSPADSAADDTREGVPVSRRSQARRVPNDEVHRSARPRPKGASSAWWW